MVVGSSGGLYLRTAPGGWCKQDVVGPATRWLGGRGVSVSTGSRPTGGSNVRRANSAGETSAMPSVDILV